jgi:hypothetical protein
MDKFLMHLTNRGFRGVTVKKLRFADRGDD